MLILTAIILVIIVASAYYWRAYGGDTRRILSKSPAYESIPFADDPDLPARLEETLREGADPSENAGPLLVQALGKSFIAPSASASTCPHPFTRPADELDWRGSKEKGDFENPPTVPWTRQEFPLAAARMDALNGRLDLLVEASRKPRLWLASKRVGDPFSPRWLVLMRASNILLSRAMLRISDGQSDQALEDVLAVHRLARLASRPVMIHYMMGTASEVAACRTSRGLAAAHALDGVQCRRWLHAIALLPPFPRYWDAAGGWICCVDFCRTISAEGIESSTLLFPNEPARPAGLRPDYRTLLRLQYRDTPRLDQAMAKPLLAERLEALHAIERDECPDDAKSILLSAGRSLDPRRTVLLEKYITKGRLSGHSVQALAEMPCRAQAAVGLASIALALESYRADHSEYCQGLEDLVGQYLPQVPTDPYSNQPFVYQKTETGYRLHSVGPDGPEKAADPFEDDRLSVSVPQVIREPKPASIPSPPQP